VPIIPRLAAILCDDIEHVRPQLVSVPPRGWIHRDEHRGGRVWQMRYTINRQTFSESTRTSDEAEARAILADRVRDLRVQQESPYLFVRAAVGHVRHRGSQPLLTRTIYHVISTKVAAIIGRRVYPRMLRHSFASRLRENGAPLANITTTLIYAQISPKKRREDVARYLEGGKEDAVS